MAKNKRKKYYAVAGTNGYGAYDNYEKVMKSHSYIKSYKCKGTNTVEEAKELAVQMFCELTGPYTVEIILKPIAIINWFYRTDFKG